MATLETETVSSDFFRHDPLVVRVSLPEMGKEARSIQSRYLSQKGMSLEFSPPFGRSHSFAVGVPVRVMVRIGGNDHFVTLEGKVLRIVPWTQGPAGEEISLVSVEFLEVPEEIKLRLRAFEIAVEAKHGKSRSGRVPVAFPVEPSGIDVMSNLVARDLSMSGMFVGTNAKFPVGKTLRLGFRLPFQKDRVSVQGKVVWGGEKSVPGSPEKVSGFGFQFTEIPPLTRAAIAMYHARTATP